MSHNPDNSGYVEGRLASMLVTASTGADAESFFDLHLELEVPESPGSFRRIRLFCRVRKTLRGLLLYQNLRNPRDPSVSSCDQDTRIGVFFHTPAGETVAHMDDIRFLEPLEEWHRRRARWFGQDRPRET